MRRLDDAAAARRRRSPRSARRSARALHDAAPPARDPSRPQAEQHHAARERRGGADRFRPVAPRPPARPAGGGVHGCRSAPRPTCRRSRCWATAASRAATSSRSASCSTSSRPASVPSAFRTASRGLRRRLWRDPVPPRALRPMPALAAGDRSCAASRSTPETRHADRRAARLRPRASRTRCALTERGGDSCDARSPFGTVLRRRLKASAAAAAARQRRRPARRCADRPGRRRPVAGRAATSRGAARDPCGASSRSSRGAARLRQRAARPRASPSTSSRTSEGRNLHVLRLVELKDWARGLDLPPRPHDLQRPRSGGPRRGASSTMRGTTRSTTSSWARAARSARAALSRQHVGEGRRRGAVHGHRGAPRRAAPADEDGLEPFGLA